MNTISPSALFGGGSGTNGVQMLPQRITSLYTFTAPGSGAAIVWMMGAGGSGARATNGKGTGGGSAAWCCARIEILPGDVLTITPGAGGTAPAANNMNGNAGGATTAALNGITIATAPGGLGGRFVASGIAAACAGSGATAQPFGDAVLFGRPGVSSGGITSTNAASGAGQFTGGAGVDLFGIGNTRSGNISVTTAGISTGGGGVGGPGADNTLAAEAIGGGAGTGPGMNYLNVVSADQPTTLTLLTPWMQEHFGGGGRGGSASGGGAGYAVLYFEAEG